MENVEFCTFGGIQWLACGAISAYAEFLVFFLSQWYANIVNSNQKNTHFENEILAYCLQRNIIKFIIIVSRLTRTTILI